MTKENDTMKEPAKSEFLFTRVFEVPVELAYKAWTDPKQLAKWWGPKDFTNPVCELDLRPGGEIRIDMTGPDGAVYPMGGIFHEIIEPQKLVFTSTAFMKEEGNWQLEVFNTVTFADENGNTKLTVHAVIVKRSPEVEAALDGMEDGWNQSLDRLGELVSKI